MAWEAGLYSDRIRHWRRWELVQTPVTNSPDLPQLWRLGGCDGFHVASRQQCTALQLRNAPIYPKLKLNWSQTSWMRLRDAAQALQFVLHTVEFLAYIHMRKPPETWWVCMPAKELTRKTADGNCFIEFILIHWRRPWKLMYQTSRRLRMADAVPLSFGTEFLWWCETQETRETPLSSDFALSRILTMQMLLDTLQIMSLHPCSPRDLTHGRAGLSINGHCGVQSIFFTVSDQGHELQPRPLLCHPNTQLHYFASLLLSSVACAHAV